MAETHVRVTFMSSGPGEGDWEATGINGSSRKPLLSDWQLLVLITVDCARDRKPRSLSPTHENTKREREPGHIPSPLLSLSSASLSAQRLSSNAFTESLAVHLPKSTEQLDDRLVNVPGREEVTSDKTSVVFITG